MEAAQRTNGGPHPVRTGSSQPNADFPRASARPQPVR